MTMFISITTTWVGHQLNHPFDQLLMPSLIGSPESPIQTLCPFFDHQFDQISITYKTGNKSPAFNIEIRLFYYIIISSNFFNIKFFDIKFIII